MRNILKIGDFSQLAQVSTRTLRHYDQLGLLKPIQIDQFSDYRLYSLDQLPRLNRILALKDLGLSLEQISEVIDTPLPASKLHAMLDAKQTQVEQQLREEKAQLMRIRARLRQIEEEDQPTSADVVLKPTEPQMVLSVRQAAPTMQEVLSHRRKLYDSAYEWLARHALNTHATTEMMIYHNSEYVEENVDMEAVVTLNDADVEPTQLSAAMCIRELSACADMATTVHHGTLFAARETLTALYAWIAQNGYTSSGPCREMHLYGRECDIADC